MLERLSKLRESDEPLWGKMNAAQMLAHVQMPISVAFGTHSVEGNWLMKLILPLFKKRLYDDRPWKKNLPTEKTFITTGDDKMFDLEMKHVVDLVSRFTESAIVNDRHPIFGKLTKEQWAKATWKHLDHHLTQFGV